MEPPSLFVPQGNTVFLLLTAIVNIFYAYLVEKVSRIFNDKDPRAVSSALSSALSQFLPSGSKQEGGGYSISIQTNHTIAFGKHKKTGIGGVFMNFTKWRKGGYYAIKKRNRPDIEPRNRINKEKKEIENDY